MKLIDKHTVAGYRWGNNCNGWVLADTEGLLVKQESIPGGTTDVLHYCSVVQHFFFILKGTATFYINDEPIDIAEQQGVLVPAGTKHHFINRTDKKLDILLICYLTSDKNKRL